MESNIVLINTVIIIIRSFLLVNLRTYEQILNPEYHRDYNDFDSFLDDEDLITEGSGCDLSSNSFSETGRTIDSWYCQSKPFVLSYGLIVLVMNITCIFNTWINMKWSNRGIDFINIGISFIQVNIGILEVFLFGFIYNMGMSEMHYWMKTPSANNIPLHLYTGILTLLSSGLQIINSIIHGVTLCNTKESKPKDVLTDYMKLVNEAEAI